MRPPSDDRRSRFEAQVLPHLDAAFRYARWLAPAPGDADDIVQEAVLRALRGFDGLRGSQVKAWLLTIVKNCHSTAIKKQYRPVLEALPDGDEAERDRHMIETAAGPEEAALLRDLEQTWERLIADLPEEHREVLVLREIEELDYREIAAVTQVPIGTVMSRLARARAALRLRTCKIEEERLHDVR